MLVSLIPTTVFAGESPPDNVDYLTFTGTGAFTVSMKTVYSVIENVPDVNLEYCTGDCSVQENWNAFTVNETEVSSENGDPIYFRGSGNTRFSATDGTLLENYNNFCLTADEEGVTVAASGNIMTLLDYDPVPETLGGQLPTT